MDSLFIKGERGIRTLGTNRLYNGLAIRRFRPLGHLSELNNFLFERTAEKMEKYGTLKKFNILY